MTNSKSTKKALFMSMLSLLLCFTMLMGATFAWFTDTVTSTGNRIQAGNLKVDLVMYDKDSGTYESIADGTGDIFSEATGNGINWEPGKTEIVYLGVRNNGNLALKYNIILDIADSGLVGSLEYAVIDEATKDAADALGISSWTDILAIDGVQTGLVPAGTVTVAQNGVLDEIVNGTQNEIDYFALAVHMKEEAGNEYQNKGIEIDVLVQATQKDAEEDSFGKDYDAAAKNPEASGTKVPENATEGTEITVGDVTVTVPENAEAADYKLVVSDENVDTIGAETTVSYDITLYKNGEKVTDDPISYPVEIEVGKMLSIASLTHNGNEITDYSYNSGTGIISFETSSFSPFAVTYTEVSKDEYDGMQTNEDGHIISGVFYGINPATMDTALAEESSEYIAINYTVDGETRYVVNDRSTTVVVAPATTDYVAENGNYTVKASQSGKLYSVISGLQNNTHSTVYLLPGTYNEGTTINVYSSMDIIGLGNAEDVKVVKVKGSYSNRHLFNCNGAVTRDEHIQVTIRNMYLDASAKNLNSAGKLYLTDNAAVQAIRLSKVKCYDLIIEKSGFPFYVNGKYDERGAYMYVENCSTTSSSVVDTADPYKFYHNNLTYNNGTEYTTNSGSILKKSMEADDWNW